VPKPYKPRASKEEVQVMGGDSAQLIRDLLFGIVPLIFALTVHEYAHALSANLLGDTTAESQGRLTLNPIPHIDPIGTLLLPVLMTIAGGGFIFGWAKPVPFNPTRFSRRITMRTGVLIVAAAGPISNLIMAFISVALISIAYHGGWLPEPVFLLLRSLLMLNVVLFVFNMLPVYPLDGQKVLSSLLPGEKALAFERFSQRYGTWMLLGVLVVGGRIIGPTVVSIVRGLTELVGLPPLI